MNKNPGEYILQILEQNLILIAIFLLAALLAVSLYASSDF